MEEAESLKQQTLLRLVAKQETNYEPVYYNTPFKNRPQSKFITPVEMGTEVFHTPRNLKVFCITIVVVLILTVGGFGFLLLQMVKRLNVAESKLALLELENTQEWAKLKEMNDTILITTDENNAFSMNLHKKMTWLAASFFRVTETSNESYISMVTEMKSLNDSVIFGITDIDECEANYTDCGYGNCINVYGSYFCDCSPGYSGENCSENIDECTPHPCLNGGVCEDLVNNFSCHCLPGFSGTHCEVDVDDCTPNPCANNGTCGDMVDDFICTCTAGFIGKYCEIELTNRTLNESIFQDLLVNETLMESSDSLFRAVRALNDFMPALNISILEEPVNGRWSHWSAWSTCSVTCGIVRIRRLRVCTSPSPAYRESRCVGHAVENLLCRAISCPVHGGWSLWGDWSDCSGTCGQGIKQRIRDCSNPVPSMLGDTCYGESSEYTLCQNISCQVNGQWTTWSVWSSCSVTCGSGTRTRLRSCENPSPSNGGFDCPGAGSETASCKTFGCPVDGAWSSWGYWGSCSYHCGGGIRKKYRSCSNPYPSGTGKACSGNSEMVEACNSSPCSENSYWTSWTAWSYYFRYYYYYYYCSTRSRSCVRGTFGGSTSCPGNDREHKYY